MDLKDNALENIKTLVNTIPPELRNTLLEKMQAHTGVMETPRMLAYKKVRADNLLLNEALLDLITNQEYAEASQPLGADSEGNFIYHEDIEIDYRQDFLLFDFRMSGGKTFAQRQLEQSLEQPETSDPTKTAMLTLYCAAKTSLYAVVGTNPMDCTITLRNLLNKAEPLVIMTDMGLSRTLKPQHHLLFTRIMRHPEFTANTGIAMIFTQRKYDKVIKSVEKYIKRLPNRLSPAEKRFIAFFHVNRALGEPVKVQ